jgi:hypothetical protein
MNMHRATFEPVPASARAARQFVGDYLSASDATGGLDLVLVLVSELATNSIVHARTVFDVWVDVTGRGVRVGVDDLDDTLPAPTPKRSRSRPAAVDWRWSRRPQTVGALHTPAAAKARGSRSARSRRTALQCLTPPLEVILSRSGRLGSGFSRTSFVRLAPRSGRGRRGLPATSIVDCCVVTLRNEAGRLRPPRV